MAFLGMNLPFGMSNASNPTINPNFPSKNQLDPKNPGADPNNQNQNNGKNEPNNDPNNNADPTKKTGEDSQLDSFVDIFKMPTDKDGNPQLPDDPLAQPLINVDAAKLKEAAGKMNFAAGINGELLQKAMSGQDPQAFMQVLNAVAQNGFFAAMQANANVVQTAFNKHTERFEAALPDRIRSTQISQTQAKHPALNHPAAAPMVAALKSQIATTNPHLSPDRVSEMAENYVIAMATDINNVNSKTNDKQKSAQKGETDWMGLLTSNG